MKRYSLFLILCQLFLSACGMLHKTTKNSSVSTLKKKEEIEVNDQSKYLHQQESGSLTIRNDSSDAFSQIEIWPKGSFDFSTEEGFSGQAEKVLIHKKKKSGRKSIEKKAETTLQTKVSDRSQSEMKTKDFSQKDMENKSAPVSAWYLLLILIPLVLLWYRLKH
jgi:hypothetical protein